jgi:hypothetical protein
MANKFTRFLSGLGAGIVSPRGTPSTYQHATRLFIDDSFRLSPRTKFSYFVRFELDPVANKVPAFDRGKVEEAGLLVKNLSLPSFSFDSVTKNQYNRKKILYKMINYDPLSLTFHDDSDGVTNALWAIYYGYYIADRQLPASAYDNNKYTPVARAENFSYRYGLDNNVSAPLLRKIHLYTMSRQRFLSYTLINPKITKWSHSDMDYGLSEPASNQMTVEFEAVQYGGGRVDFNSPQGFANLHYDSSPSPLSVAGGGISSLTGSGGVLDGLEQIFGAVSSGTAFDSPASALGTIAKTINTYENIKDLDARSLGQEAVNILSSPQGAETIANTISGVSGAIFPKSNTEQTTTSATQKRVAPPGIQ